MTDEKGQQEPSMEDILASIRRILSEDDIEEPAAAPAPVKTEPKPEPEPEDDIFELTDEMVAAEPESEAEPEEDVDAFDLAGFEVEPDLEPEPEPEPELESELDTETVFEAEPEQEESLAPEFTPEPEPEPPSMFARQQPSSPIPEEALVAPAVAEASTQALTELARAVARERGIGLGTRGVTLEDMVREILKPVLKDWLDQNLPYMVERIVRKEIERLVNRAERQ